MRQWTDLAMVPGELQFCAMKRHAGGIGQGPIRLARMA